MLSLNEVIMETATVIRVITASATALTNVALIGGIVWSIAAGVPLIMPVTLGALLLPFGYFSFTDYKRFFGTKQ
jgi:hypothetical protein